MRPSSVNQVELSRRADIANFFAPKDIQLPIIHSGILTERQTLLKAKKLNPKQTYPVTNPYTHQSIQMTGAKILERIQQRNLPTIGMVIAKGRQGNGTWYVVLKEHFDDLASQPKYVRYD